ncbi:MAG: helicase-related protein [Candidatus Saccharibacteria bacterium]
MPAVETLRLDFLAPPELKGASEQPNSELIVLPIDACEKEIIEAFLNNQIVVLEGGTGCGKSSRVCKILKEAGFPSETAEPRILATSSLASRVRNEQSIILGSDATKVVGYRTANERSDHPDNEILFLTDGILVNHYLFEHRSSSRPAFTPILDEVHEGNLNTEVLMGLMKLKAAADPNFKAILMSATIDTKVYADFFKDETGKPAPIISIPGRTYEVEERDGGMFQEEIVKYALAGNVVLSFVGGKGDITKTNDAISGPLRNKARVLALHGDQTSSEQNEIFVIGDLPNVITSTKIGETSITVPNGDVVIDSGWERISKVINGVESLIYQRTSAASADQRRGRVGRTKPGIYVRTQLEGFPKNLPSQTTKAYDEPAIQRERLDGMFLKLALAGIDFSTLDTPHKANPENMRDAKQRLIWLGALAATGEITEAGQDLNFLPLEPNLALSVVTARDPKYSESVALHVAAAVAVQGAKGIVQYHKESLKRWQALSEGQTSDVQREMDVFVVALNKAGDFFEEHDITEKRFIRARDTFLKLCEAEQLDPAKLGAVKDETERAQITECLIAGADEIMIAHDKGFIDRRGTYRRLMPETTIPEDTKFVVGSPFMLQIMSEVKTPRPTKGASKEGAQVMPKNIDTVRGASAIASVELLEKAAPERCTYRIKKSVIGKDGNARIVKELYFDDVATGHTKSEAAVGSAEMNEFLIRRVITGDLPKAARALPKVLALHETIRELRQLAVRSLDPLDVKPIIDSLVTSLSSQLPTSCTSLADLGSRLPGVAIESLLDSSKISLIYEESPDSITIAGLIADVAYEPNKMIVTISIDSWNLLPDRLVKRFPNREIFLRDITDDSKAIPLANAFGYANKHLNIGTKRRRRMARAARRSAKAIAKP